MSDFVYLSEAGDPPNETKIRDIQPGQIASISRLSDYLLEVTLLDDSTLIVVCDVIGGVDDLVSVELWSWLSGQWGG